VAATMAVEAATTTITAITTLLVLCQATVATQSHSVIDKSDQQQNQIPQGRGNAGHGNNPLCNQRNNTPPEVNIADQVPAATSSSMSSNSSTQRISFNSDQDGHFLDALPTVQSSFNDLDSFLNKDTESFFCASEKTRLASLRA
jgi:hypothetical protein